MFSVETQERLKKRSAKVTPYVVIALFIVTILQALALANLSNRSIPESPVYGVASSGSITELIAVGYTPKTGITLSNFAATAATYCMTMDFGNYNVVLDECEDIHFSTQGMNQFKNALRRSGIASDLQSQNLIQEAVLGGTPTIVDPGKQDNASAFIIEVPITLEQEKETGSYLVQGVSTVTVSTVSNKKQLDQFRVIGFNFTISS